MVNALCPWCERGDARVRFEFTDNDGRRWHDVCARECCSTWMNAAEQARLRERAALLLAELAPVEPAAVEVLKRHRLVLIRESADKAGDL